MFKEKYKFLKSKLKYLNFNLGISKNTLFESFLINQNSFKENINSCSIDNSIKKSFEDDPLLIQVYKEFYLKYKNKFKSKQIILHCLPRNISPGGYSIFLNYYSALTFLGINASMITSGKYIEKVLNKEADEIIFLSSDNESYLSDIPSINYLKNLHNKFVVGLVADPYSKTSPVEKRIKQAEKNAVNFYFSYSHKYYTDNSELFSFHRKSSIQLFNNEFAADCFEFYPKINIHKKYDYCFLASSNSDKRDRYYSYLQRIFSKYFGLINGPGWPFSRFILDKFDHNFIYSQSKVGINLHIPLSIEEPCELNERTYTLASAGIPQLIDNAKLINYYFPDKSLFIAKNPNEYLDLFEYILRNPKEAANSANLARNALLQKHTIFHRMDNLLSDLLKNKIISDNV